MAGIRRPLLTPRRVLLAAVALILIVVVLVPVPEAAETPSLSSYGTSPSGARGLYEVLERLGFRVQRRHSPLRDSVSAQAVYVVLAPPIDLTLREVNDLLAAVRAGAGLLYVPLPGSRLADSLGVTVVEQMPVSRGADRRPEPGPLSRELPGWTRRVLRLDTARDVRWEPSREAYVFLWVRTPRGAEPMIVSQPFGQGRVAIVADPDLLRNSVVRQGSPGVRAVRLIEWLSGDASRPIVFDEYHHGFGVHPAPLRAGARALLRTGPGRALLVLAVAGLVLLLAVGVRPIRPTPQLRIERRSPLEHVDALARAYAAVHGTRHATHLLVRGLRRRRGLLRSSQDDADFLRALDQQHGELRGEIRQVLAAIEGAAVPPGAIAGAIRRIEEGISR